MNLKKVNIFWKRPSMSDKTCHFTHYLRRDFSRNHATLRRHFSLSFHVYQAMFVPMRDYMR